MPVLAPSRVVTDPAWPAAANLDTAPPRLAPLARPERAMPAESSRSQDLNSLSDWQVALLLGGTALGGLASALAGLTGLSWLL